MLAIKKTSNCISILAGLFYVTVAQASEVDIPNTFQANTPAVAAEVNGNFSAVKVAVDDNYSRVSSLETLVQEQADLISSLQGQLEAMQAQLESMQASVETLENSEVAALNPYLSVDTVNDPRGPLVTLTGVNLQVVNGSGASLDLETGASNANGLGNIIIGYDEGDVNAQLEEECSIGNYATREECEANGYIWSNTHKSGSHYLVIGPHNSYSQSVGIVAGIGNFSTNLVASAIGGYNNRAKGVLSTISGGSRGIASGAESSISGGIGNAATGPLSSVLGGSGNVASESHSVVVGGIDNHAAGRFSVTLGGGDNTASGNMATVTGGQAGNASGVYSSVTGGRENTASGPHSTVSGGALRTASGSDDWRAGDLSAGN